MTVTRKRRRAQSWSWQRATSWQQSLRPSLKRFVRPIKKPSPPSASLANTPRWVLCKDLSAYTTINKTEWVHFFLPKHDRFTVILWLSDPVLLMAPYAPGDGILQTCHDGQPQSINNQFLVLYSNPHTPLTFQASPLFTGKKIMKRCMVITLKSTSWLFSGAKDDSRVCLPNCFMLKQW